MNINNSTAVVARALLLAGVIALGAGAFGHTSIVSAAAEWDIAAYDECVTEIAKPRHDCCVESGGEWHGENPGGYCTAPPANGVFGGATSIDQRQERPGRQPILPSATIGSPAS